MEPPGDLTRRFRYLMDRVSRQLQAFPNISNQSVHFVTINLALLLTNGVISAIK